MSSNVLVKKPIIYEPTLNDKGIYTDFVGKYTWSEFEEYGIKCPCIKNTKTIHRSKQSFRHQHCKTRKHIEYIEFLNKDPGVNNNVQNNNKELKELKVRLGKEHQNYLIEKQRCQTIQTQLKDVISENENMRGELNDTTQFINKTVSENKILKDKLKQYENITKKMMKLENYEIENE
tara:strand:- start:34891 stop:35421 length:531 start_codon:yes stop_codon:yes gene_type:complete